MVLFCNFAPQIYIPLKFIKQYILFASFALLSACSGTKYVPEGDYLLDKVEVKSELSGFDASSLSAYVKQTPNTKWFSLFRIPLATYSLSGRDTTKWVNRTLRNIGQAPVVYDTLLTNTSSAALSMAMRNRGYMHADVDVKTKRKGKKIKVVYELNPGEQYTIGSIRYDIEDDSIAKILKNDKASMLRRGAPFTVDKLDAERKRITSLLMDRGYYRFHKDFITYSADSSRYSSDINVTLHLSKYRANNNLPETLHPCYSINSINYLSGNGADDSIVHLRHKVMAYNTAIKLHRPFSATDLQTTYNNFARLKAVRYTNIRFNEVPDTTLLDCNIQVSTNKPHSISFQPEGTNTAGDLGAAASLTYENRNIFRGSELLSIELRGAFEAITGLEGYQNQDYVEYNAEAKLQFPRFVAPFLSRTFRRRSKATSELSVAWNMQNRPEFHRRVFSTAWRYRWAEPHHHLSYRFDLLDLNYVYMPWISATFKHDYLDSVSNRNAILRYNYEDLFIMKLGFGISYNTDNFAFRANIESAGNLLDAFARVAKFHTNSNGQHTFLNIAYAQYAKFDFDCTRLFRFDAHNTLALHGAFGIAYPYGNSTVLPFEKRYFSGGANSVRGWGVRELGPGRFRGTDGRIDFINQTGDMKLDLSAEYRTYLFWKFDGAAFVDAGNIWTLRSYAEQPGGQFHFTDFYKQIAVAYGIGLRLNFGYFILRFDMGMKAINPAYETKNEHYAFLHPDFSRDFSFHFAVGMPF